MKKFLDKIIDFFKTNPLWVIIILLILMNVLLLNISLRIGHNYAENIFGFKKWGAKPTGLYRAIYNVGNECPCDLSEIKERLNDIYYSLPY